MTRAPKKPEHKDAGLALFEKFKKLAEESGCEDNDAAFDQTLKRLAETPPPETVQERKTRGALKLGVGGKGKTTK